MEKTVQERKTGGRLSSKPRQNGPRWTAAPNYESAALPLRYVGWVTGFYLGTSGLCGCGAGGHGWPRGLILASRRAHGQPPALAAARLTAGPC